MYKPTRGEMEKRYLRIWRKRPPSGREPIPKEKGDYFTKDNIMAKKHGGKSQPKISDFGAVDDEGKRSISLWHKQTPGIPGVDFHLERLYNILQ